MSRQTFVYHLVASGGGKNIEAGEKLRVGVKCASGKKLSRISDPVQLALGFGK